MKLSAIAIVSIFILSCSKNPAITDTPPNPPGPTNTDSAKSIYIIAKSNAGVTSLSAYGAARDKKWEQPIVQPISFWNMPDYGDSKIFLSSINTMYSFNAANGTVNWTYNNSTANVLNPRFKNDTIVTAASVIAPSASNALLLLSKSTGSVIWSKVITNQPVIRPLLDGGKIFVLTTNSNGTQMTLSAYDIVSKNLDWQTILSNAFLMGVPSDMLVRNDTLIVGAATNRINLVNKNTGTVYWSKGLNTNNAFLYNNEIVYNDISAGRVTRLSLQTGNVVLQSAPINFTQQNGLSYIYENAFYNKVRDTIYCTNLADGILKWKKINKETYYKLIVVGNKLYGSKTNAVLNDESQLVILDAVDFSAKDSIIVPKRDLLQFSVLSTTGQFY
jgi:outer membrane protein assembly factor BamB